MNIFARFAFLLLFLPQLDALAQSDSLSPIVVAKVIEAPVSSGYRVVGTVTPLRSSTIGAAAAGRVSDFYVDVGQPVTQGQPLAQLRTETLKIELKAAEAELDLYRQQLAELENGSREEDIMESEARALVARAAMDNASKQLKRLETLSTSRAATAADIEDARERANATKHAFAAAEATLKRVKQGPRIEQIAQARAQVELQLQQTLLIEDRIKKFTIVAPFDGFVAEEFTEVGSWISSGDPVARVIQLDEIEILAPVTAERAVRIQRGASIRVEFPELPKQLLIGEVDRIVPVAEDRARTFPLYIRLKNEFREGVPLLMSGMLARVELPAGQQQVLPLVPKDALVLNESSRSVFVVDANGGDTASAKTGVVRSVEVELGVAVGDLIQVRGDLKAGQQVVIVGNERLIPGAQVSVVSQRETVYPDS